MGIKEVFARKTGLVLSGGAVRGFAHLGVLQAMNEKDIEPDLISGVSAGAIVGSLYADGYSPKEILQVFEEKKFYSFLNLQFKSSGLADIAGLKELLESALRAFHISVASQINQKKKEFSFFIEPRDLRKFGYFNISNGREMFDIGYKEAQNVLSL